MIVRTSRLIFTAAAVGAMAMMTLTSAEARYRHAHAYRGYVVSEASCSLVPPASLYIFPAPNWEAFFRRHVYRYGPIYSSCDAAAESTNVVSVRY
jgi:hypothetical protein